MSEYILTNAHRVRVGDILQDAFRVGEITHGALDGTIKFRDESDTATAFFRTDETVTIQKDDRARIMQLQEDRAELLAVLKPLTAQAWLSLSGGHQELIDNAMRTIEKMERQL